MSCFSDPDEKLAIYLSSLCFGWGSSSLTIILQSVNNKHVQIKFRQLERSNSCCNSGSIVCSCQLPTACSSTLCKTSLTEQLQKIPAYMGSNTTSTLMESTLKLTKHIKHGNYRLFWFDTVLTDSSISKSVMHISTNRFHFCNLKFTPSSIPRGQRSSKFPHFTAPLVSLKELTEPQAQSSTKCFIKCSTHSSANTLYLRSM